jgi:hypothetical protein
LEQFKDGNAVSQHADAMRRYFFGIAQEIEKKKHAKLLMLADHFGISHGHDDTWLKLSLKLAEHFMPGFEVRLTRGKRGPPEKWNEMQLAKLYCSVMLKNKSLEERGNTKSYAAACSVLSKSGYWKAAGSGKTLHNKFDEAKKTNLVRMLDRVADDPNYGHRIYKDFLQQMTGDVGEMRKIE